MTTTGSPQGCEANAALPFASDLGCPTTQCSSRSPRSHVRSVGSLTVRDQITNPACPAHLCLANPGDNTGF
jgi:hypothetical protein